MFGGDTSSALCEVMGELKCRGGKVTVKAKRTVFKGKFRVTAGSGGGWEEVGVMVRNLGLERGKEVSLMLGGQEEEEVEFGLRDGTEQGPW